MSFDKDKKEYLSKLYKPDNSKKGSVDKEIKELIEKINKLDDYYTTSSCAGRIVLIIIPKSGRKDHAKWLFISHDQVNFNDLFLDNLPNDIVWFRQEAAIIHVCCKDLESAQRFINKARLAGFKRCAIMAAKKRVMVEVFGSESMDAPISKNKKLLVDIDYIKFLVEEANKKLKKTREKVKKLLKEL